ncbi:hypothetical protein O7635_30030 [Asanoa sp. WMMD1127]|uniref:phosphotransferase n=1 Tax=Asanoa sp. WMMD1127 TaxID=3016107 RepID=UPI002417C5B0|nr:phosphotransferase [Asanoa sp. WMMD1127]MDG4826109.1 hypothetical protein [Asanoa sp. WMMD1127]
MTGFARRPSWTATPGALRREVDRICGSPVVGSRDVHGGMSPGPAALLDLADGRQVFVKAVSRDASIGSHRAYEREAATLAALPAGAPAPELFGCARVGGWLALVMSVAAGEAADPPWTADGVRLVGAACATIGSLAAPPTLPPIAALLTDLDGWERLTDRDEWEGRHAPALVALASGWRAWTAGDRLVHQDVRGDNAVVDRPGGRATLVDWSFGCAGAPWLDRARLAADIVCAGHRDGAALAAAVEVLDTLPGEAVRFVAALAGMWRYRSTLPALSGHPTLRGWQARRAIAIRPLLAALL